MIKTPDQWLEMIPSHARAVSGEQIDGRNVLVLEYMRNDGSTVRMWVDRYYGVPVKVLAFLSEPENELERYIFKDLTINSVKTEDVTPDA